MIQTVTNIYRFILMLLFTIYTTCIYSEDFNNPELWSINIQNNSIHEIKSLLNDEIEVSVQDKNTELLLAILRNDKYLVKKLIENGSDVNSIDINGVTPLITASFSSKKEIIIDLINNGADVNKPDFGGVTPILSLTRRSDLSLEEYKYLLKLYIEKGAILNDKIKGNPTILNFAIINTNIRIVNYLIQSGAYINDKDYANNSPLYTAIKEQDIELIRLLLNSGANINEHNEEGVTALIYATWIKNKYIVKLLLDNGADLLATDSLSRTALDYALERDYKEIIDLLNSY